MSDSEKLRRIYGNLYSIGAFVLFALAINIIWIAFIFLQTPQFIFISICISLFLFIFSYFSMEKSYKYFIGVSKEKIHKSASAELKKVTGISLLTVTFILLTAIICSIWSMIVWGVLIPDLGFLAVPIFIFSLIFPITYMEACSNFIMAGDYVS